MTTTTTLPASASKRTALRSRKKIEAAAATQPEAAVDTPKGKVGGLVALLRRYEGATLDQMIEATGWQAHSVRGAMSGAIKKKLGLKVESTKGDGVRVWRIPGGQA